MSTHLAVVTPCLPAHPIFRMATPWPDGRETDRLGKGDAVHFRQGSAIYSDGDVANIFFKVVSGVVRTCKFLKEGRCQIDAFLMAGDVFGMDASAHYNFSAEAVSDCSLMSYRRGLAETIAGNTGISEQMLSCAMHSVARAQAHALFLGRRSASEKVAAFLLDWAKRSASGRDIVLSMTREDIADYLGLTIETVSRTLLQLKRQKAIVIVSSRKISVSNLTALRSSAANPYYSALSRKPPPQQHTRTDRANALARAASASSMPSNDINNSPARRSFATRTTTHFWWRVRPGSTR